MNRSPRKSASVSWCRWIIVPIAPSRTRMRVARRASSCARTLGVMVWCVWCPSSVSRRALVPDAISTVNGSPALRAPTPTLTSASPAAASIRLQLVVGEAEPAIAELGAHPLLVVRAQIEQQHAAAGRRDARRFGDRARRIVRVVQRLRQHRDVDRRVLHRQLLELALLPDHVRDAAAPRQRLGARRAPPRSDRRRSTREAQRAASIVR